MKYNTARRRRATRHTRRTSEQMGRIRAAIYDTLQADHPSTVRSLFYRLVSGGIVPKTESAYKSLVVRLATKMRLDGSLPFEWLADNTRWRHGAPVFTSMSTWLEESLQTYRLDLWRDQDAYVELWIEKDALSGVLLHETDSLCVPLMVCRGYPSVSYIASAASHIRAVNRPTFIYYVGDYDPTGLDIPRHVEKRLREFAPDSEIYFNRLAVNEEQIGSLNLPTRPTKTSDSRARHFSGRSVEADAIPASALRQMVREAIERHIDPAKLAATRREEAAMRECLAAIRLPSWGVQ